MPNFAKQTQDSTQQDGLDAVATAAGQLAITSKSSAFQITASKPGLLAQIQAVSQQAASSPLARQQSNNQNQSNVPISEPGDLVQAFECPMVQ